jgi:hypothetical protein
VTSIGVFIPDNFADFLAIALEVDALIGVMRGVVDF